jgi:predicted phosphodiesterase
MKLAVLADVHANWPALQAVAADIEQWQADRVVVAGDLINRGPRPVECADFVLAKKWPWVRGNHEEYVLGHMATQAARTPQEDPSFWTYGRLNGQVATVAALPFQVSWRMPDGSEARIVHASMRSTRDCIFVETLDAVLREQIAPAPKLFVVGHTHRPLRRVLDETLVVNVGSAGLPFDGDHRASYARLTWQRGVWDAEIVRLEYDRVQADRDFDETGFIAQAGPLARLMRAELQQARSTLYEWSCYYQAAVTSGEMSLEESVKRVLAA